MAIRRSPEPEVMANRVNVDTGAFIRAAVALVIDGAEKQILAVEGEGFSA